MAPLKSCWCNMGLQLLSTGKPFSERNKPYQTTVRRVPGCCFVLMFLAGGQAGTWTNRLCHRIRGGAAGHRFGHQCMGLHGHGDFPCNGEGRQSAANVRVFCVA